MMFSYITLIAILLRVAASEQHTRSFQNIDIDLTDNTFVVKTDPPRVPLSGRFNAAGPWESCSTNEQELCIRWPGIQTLSIQPREDVHPENKCWSFTWKAITISHKPRVCFDLSKNHWYGGAEMYHQRWPIEQQSAHAQPYYSNDYLERPDDVTKALFGPILEPYWINSAGFGIHVPGGVPLHVSLNENSDEMLCLRADARGFMTHDAHTYVPELTFILCSGANVRVVHEAMSAMFARPQGLPDERMLRSPVWSTWARFKTAVNQSAVLKYAGEIVQHGFSNSQIEIDDMYTTTYGDLTFDPLKFPNPLDMSRELNRMGFRITAWVTPYANLDSKAFQEGMVKGYWLKDSRGRVPGLVRWWQGVGAVLDTTNPEAVDWFVGRLEQFREESGLDSYKFDSGEVGFLPDCASSSVLLQNPNEFTAGWAALVSRLGTQAEMRAASGTQQHPIFLRMMDKDSRWGYDNGLRTLIPTALLMSLLGYNYILPDMIGGNAYDPVDPLHSSVLPDRELYIRWVQLSAFLPAMQFSVAPWQYDEEVVAICKQMVQIHEEIVTPVLLQAAETAITTGTPIIRPLWWLDPDDPHSLDIDSEFLVADEILVAPILDEGARSRDIYLPRGTWEDRARHETHTGPSWIYNYGAELDEIAVFYRMNKFKL